MMRCRLFSKTIPFSIRPMRPFRNLQLMISLRYATKPGRSGSEIRPGEEQKPGKKVWKKAMKKKFSKWPSN